MPPKHPKRPHLTHFLCIPLLNSSSRPVLEAALAGFKVDFLAARPSDIAAKGGSDAAAAWQRAVRPVGALHLTLGVMSLREKARLEEAVEVLEGLDLGRLLMEVRSASSEQSSEQSQVSPPSLIVCLRSLHPMQSPSNTSTLYAAPHDPTGRLQPFCERLKAILTERGLLLEENRPLKLHATVANTIYAKLERKSAGRGGNADREKGVEEVEVASAKAGAERDEQRGDEQRGEHGEDAAGEHGTSEGDGARHSQGPAQQQHLQPVRRPRKGQSRPIRFNARALLEKYVDFVWAADVTLDQVVICEMGAKKVTDEGGNVVDEAYTEVAVKALPM